MYLSRRTLLRTSLVAGAGAALAACARDDNSGSGSSSSAAPTTGGATTAPVSSGASSGSSAAAPAGKKIDLGGAPVAALFTSLNNDYYSSWGLGAQRAVEAFGGEYRAFTNEGDPAREISQFEQQVQDGVKIFFMTAPDPAPVPTIAQKATDAGVFLCNTWEMNPWTSPFDYGNGYVTYFSAKSEQAAYEVAKALFDKMGGAGNFVHITGHPGATPDTQRTQGVDRALKDYPDIKMLARQPGEWNRDDSRQAMAGIITQFGKDIQGVFGQNDDVGIGCLNALQEAGITDVPVTGMDGNLGTMELIQSGQFFGAYSSLPFWSAGFSFVRAVDAMQGVQFDPLDRQLWCDGIFVTADNVDAYVDTFYGDTDPFDWQKMSRAAYPDDWDPQNGLTPIVMDQMWQGFDKPAGWTAPAEYTAALPNLQKISDEYADHWKIKLL
jgi:ribose transport system substrate-binding protein